MQFKNTPTGKAIRTAYQTFAALALLAIAGWLTNLTDYATGTTQDLNIDTLKTGLILAAISATSGLISWLQNHFEQAD